MRTSISKQLAHRSSRGDKTADPRGEQKIFAQVSCNASLKTPMLIEIDL